MEYLLILLLGVLIGRYFLSIFDSLLDIVTAWFTLIYNKIQVATNIVSKKYQNEYESDDKNIVSAIGYNMNQIQNDELEYEDDESEIENRKIGF